MLRFIPKGVTANFVTLSTFAVMWIVFGLAVQSDPVSVGWFAAITLVCVQVYVIGDHVDGLWAVATNTTSPLGEFLDHYCDVYSGAVMVLAGYIVMAGVPRWVFYGMLWLYFLAFAATFVERRRRQVLHFARLGTLEGIIILSAFFASVVIPTTRHLWTLELLPGVPAIWSFILFAAAVLVGTVAFILHRLREIPKELAVFAGTGLVLAGWLSAQSSVPLWYGWILLTAYSAAYIGRVMESHVLNERHAYPNLVASGMLLIPAAVAPVWSPPLDVVRWWMAVTATYLVTHVVWSLIQILRVLRVHWVWTNPSSVRSAES